MDWNTIALFAVASLALTATPGPDMLLVAARSAAQGRRAGFITYLGVATGSLIHAAFLAVGLSQLFLAVPYAFDAVRLVGAAYLAFLAWQAFAGRGGMAQTPQVAARGRALWSIFRQGMWSNVLNPKVALFFLALFPQFIDPAAGPVAVQVLILALVLNVVGLFVNGTVVLVAASVRSFTGRAARFERLSRYFLGTVFAGLAAKLVLDGGR